MYRDDLSKAISAIFPLVSKIPIDFECFCWLAEAVDKVNSEEVKQAITNALYRLSIDTNNKEVLEVKQQNFTIKIRKVNNLSEVSVKSKCKNQFIAFFNGVKVVSTYTDSSFGSDKVSRVWKNEID